MKIVLKGVMTAEDARLAVEHGVDGVVVSNHGGRALDWAMPSLDALPEVVDAVDGRLEVYLDGGVRRGIARAEGARARGARGAARPADPVGARERAARRAWSGCFELIRGELASVDGAVRRDLG